MREKSMYAKYRVSSILLGIGLVLLAGKSLAQVPDVDANEISATSGVLLPSPSITETHDATALAINPGNMGFLDSWSFVYVGSWLKQQQRIAGQGHGFFLGLPIGPVGFGIGVEPLFPPE